MKETKYIKTAEYFIYLGSLLMLSEKYSASKNRKDAKKLLKFKTEHYYIFKELDDHTIAEYVKYVLIFTDKTEIEKKRFNKIVFSKLRPSKLDKVI